MTKVNSNNGNNKPYRIYDKTTRQWFEVTPEQYKEFDRERTNKRKREQFHGRCMCPRSKWWLCDGMCEDCEFHAPGDMLSLDAPVESEDGIESTLGDVLPSGEDPIEEVILDQILMEQLLKRLLEIMPEAKTIGELRLKNMKDDDIADIIGINRNTFRSRIKKAKEILKEEFGDDLPF